MTRPPRRRRWIVPTAAAVALAGVWAVAGRPPAADAKPGVVTSKAGDPYAGDVTEDDKFVYVTTPAGRVSLDRRNVSRIDYAEQVQAEYDRRHATLGPKDAAGRIDLAYYANEHRRSDLAMKALAEARQLDPASPALATATSLVQKQVQIDRTGGNPAGTATTTGPSVATSGPATTGPATATAAGAKPPEFRLLNADEINRVRQVEMRADDPLVHVRLQNNVARRYTLGAYGSATGEGAKRFARFTPQEQALEILGHGSPAMANDVRILTDPQPLQTFKNKVMPVIATGCASTSCHGGDKAGDFYLYQGNSAPATYTNFYILMTYAAQVNGVQYVPLDREVPTRSLVLQFGLPALVGQPPHPKVAGWRPKFKGRDDASYVLIETWLTDSLRVIQPRYGFNVSPRKPAKAKPTTAPATGPTTRPT